MKTYITLTLASFLLNSCTYFATKKDKKPEVTIEDIQQKEVLNNEVLPPAPTFSFDIATIPITKKLTEVFPYFKIPTGYHFINPRSSNDGTGKISDYDKEYFLNKGNYVVKEGKTFKAIIRTAPDAGDKVFSELELQKSFDNLIASIGGVKINSKHKLLPGEAEKLNEKDPNAYTQGYLHSCHNWSNIHTYVIRKENKEVWVQYNFGSDAADITILETKPFESKMELLEAEAIKKELDSKGRAVLYIKFDTDKATLKPDGILAVAEITTLLQNYPELKLSIEGHTDNVGDAAHNMQLSLARAQATEKALLKNGIDQFRIESKGFGSEKELVKNDTEANKAKNRRVELVKM